MKRRQSVSSPPQNRSGAQRGESQLKSEGGKAAFPMKPVCSQSTVSDIGTNSFGLLNSWASVLLQRVIIPRTKRRCRRACSQGFTLAGLLPATSRLHALDNYNQLLHIRQIGKNGQG